MKAVNLPDQGPLGDVAERKLLRERKKDRERKREGCMKTDRQKTVKRASSQRTQGNSECKIGNS